MNPVLWTLWINIDIIIHTHTQMYICIYIFFLFLQTSWVDLYYVSNPQYYQTSGWFFRGAILGQYHATLTINNSGAKNRGLKHIFTHNFTNYEYDSDEISYKCVKYSKATKRSVIYERVYIFNKYSNFIFTRCALRAKMIHLQR